MTIFEDSVYWSERYTSKVMRTNKFHGSNITTIMSSVYQPMGIVMDHPIKQPTGNFSSYVIWKQGADALKPHMYHNHRTTIVGCSLYWKTGFYKKKPVFTCYVLNSAINPCIDHLCTQLCLLSGLRPRYYSCHCQSGWKLDADKRTCIKGILFILFNLILSKIFSPKHIHRYSIKVFFVFFYHCLEYIFVHLITWTLY